MSPETAPPPARRSSLLLLLRTVITVSSILLSIGYACVILVREWDTTTTEKMFASRVPTLRALLFQNGARLDLFDATSRGVIVRLKTANQLAGQPAGPLPQLLSTRAVLLTTGEQSQVQDLWSSYSYDPLATGSQSSLISLSRNTNFTYSIQRDQLHAKLIIDFAACGTIASIPLPEKETWYDADTVFRPLRLPMQQRMTLSPAETSLALSHHDTSPRITLVRLLERNAFTLSVPSFDPEQLHFSPFFIDDETLLFSVLDRNHWGTVRYRIRTGTYEMLSENFTDHAYHTLSGDILLQQSFYDEVTNVPFGAITLLERFRDIAPREIETLIGPKESHPELFALLFQDPDAPRLHFKTDLTTQSFNVIAESDLREILRTYWRDYQLELTNPVGEFRFVKLLPDDTLESNGAIPFAVHAPATFAQFTEDVEPLLRALALPDKLIEEYRKRSATAMQKGQEYLLVDDLSY